MTLTSLQDRWCRTFHRIAPGYWHNSYDETHESCLTCGRALRSLVEYPRAPRRIMRVWPTPEVDTALTGLERDALERELDEMRGGQDAQR